jgi:predicted DNA-binding transcriptional regulator YafY
MRTVRPSGLAFLSPVWLVAAWCELREGFRNFRADRIADIERLEAFVDEPGKTMEDFLAVVRAEGGGT